MYISMSQFFFRFNIRLLVSTMFVHDERYPTVISIRRGLFDIRNDGKRFAFNSGNSLTAQRRRAANEMPSIANTSNDSSSSSSSTSSDGSNSRSSSSSSSNNNNSYCHPLVVWFASWLVVCSLLHIGWSVAVRSFAACERRCSDNDRCFVGRRQPRQRPTSLCSRRVQRLVRISLSDVELQPGHSTPQIFKIV